jgi:uncharacterized protein (TIGR00299 family) protein
LAFEREKKVKTLYFDCFSGISGDMTIGALVDVGVDFDYLKTEIGKLPVDGFELRLSRTVRANISAAKFDVVVPGDSGHDHGHSHSHDHEHDHQHPHSHEHRKASQIMDMIRGSTLGGAVRERAIGIFEKLAISEGRVHDLPPEDVEFHEVGAIDSIVDVVGTAIGLEALEVERFECSAINVGGGFIHCQHGIYPVPAPATANLLAHAPVYSRHVEKELVTPTGAAILAATIDRFGPIDGMAIEGIGYGAGTQDLGEFPNCLRLFLGTDVQGTESEEGDLVTVVEANIDDMSAEQLSYAAEKLLASGALDVVTIPVLMKKGRPGHLLQVLVTPADEGRISRLMFEETTTIGVRKRTMARQVLARDVVEVPVESGTIRVKVSWLDGRPVTVSPEYDDCARVAKETNRPFHEVRDDAIRSYREIAGERSNNG